MLGDFNMATYYEIRNYLLKPDRYIYRLTFDNQPLDRSWRVGKLQYTLESKRAYQENNEEIQNRFEDVFETNEYDPFDEYVGGLEQINDFEKYMNYGISLQLVSFDTETRKTKTIGRRDYTFDDFDKDVVRRSMFDISYDPNNEHASYIVYAQELEADPYTSRVNETGAYVNRTFTPCSPEEVYLETSDLTIASQAAALISPKDLFYNSIKGEQRELNFVNRAFEVCIFDHRPEMVFGDLVSCKQFTYDDWHKQEYPEEHFSICDQEESQKILSNNKIHRR